jgi:hypothetical protein
MSIHVSWRCIAVLRTTVWTWIVDVYCVVRDPGSAWSVCTVNVINTNIVVGDPTDLVSSRTGVIPAPVIDVHIVYDVSISQIATIPVPVVIWVTIIIDIALRDKVPPEIRGIKTYIDVYAWSQWRPTVISAATSPVYPCRAPGCIRDPQPFIVSVRYPSSIVKWCPAPVVITYPGISVLCHYPVPIGIIRPELTLVYIRPPYVAVFGILDPCTVR